MLESKMFSIPPPLRTSENRERCTMTSRHFTIVVEGGGQHTLISISYRLCLAGFALKFSMQGVCYVEYVSVPQVIILLTQELRTHLHAKYTMYTFQN